MRRDRQGESKPSHVGRGWAIGLRIRTRRADALPIEAIFLDPACGIGALLGHVDCHRQAGLSPSVRVV